MSNLELDLDFDLDKEVQLWCRAVHRFGWNRQARIIVISLVFAAAITLASYLIADTQYEGHAQMVTYLLIAIWFVPFTWLSAAGNGKSVPDSIKCDWALIKRKFSRLGKPGV